MTQALIPEKISSSLNQLLSHLKDFQQSLSAESDILKSSDMQGIDEALATKEQSANQITEAFSSFLASVHIEALSLNELAEKPEIQALPDNIQTQLQEVITLSKKCQSMNNSNGMMVRSLSNINQTFLNILKGQDPAAETYGASGKTASSEIKNNNPLSKA